MSKNIDITNELISREETSGYSFEKSKEVLNEKEIQEAVNNMTEEELNNYIFFALQEICKKCDEQKSKNKRARRRKCNV